MFTVQGEGRLDLIYSLEYFQIVIEIAKDDSQNQNMKMSLEIKKKELNCNIHPRI